MDFGLTPEQSLMKQSVERFVAENYAFERRGERNAAAGFSAAHWASFAELGWLGLPIPEERGGFGGSVQDTAILMEAFGAGLVTEPYVASVVVAGALLASADSAVATTLLDATIEGSERTTYAFAEPQSGYDPAFVRTRAVRDGDALTINGAKVSAPSAASAGHVIVSVRTSGEDASPHGITLVAVPIGADRLRRHDYDTYDERRASDLTFENVRAPLANMIGPLDGGLPLLDAAIDRGNVALCAEAVGIMSVLQRGTVEYLKTRTQFGRPIGSFQALQHRAVDMLVQLELARAITAYAASALDGADVSAARAAAAAAKVQICDSGRYVGEQAIQLHGAIGLTEELSVGHYVKRLTMLQRELSDGAFAIKRYLAATA